MWFTTSDEINQGYIYLGNQPKRATTFQILKNCVNHTDAEAHKCLRFKKIPLLIK